MSLSPSLVIRIVPDEGEAVDWTVHQNIVFRDVLVCSHEKLKYIIIPDHEIKLMFACLKISRLKIHPIQYIS